jgi:hypothetical protein
MNKLLVNLKKECPDTSVSTIPAQLRGHFRVVVHVAFADLAGSAHKRVWWCRNQAKNDPESEPFQRVKFKIKV